jgi:hypothetical protein
VKAWSASLADGDVLCHLCRSAVVGITGLIGGNGASAYCTMVTVLPLMVQTVEVGGISDGQKPNRWLQSLIGKVRWVFAVWVPR